MEAIVSVENYIIISFTA